MDRPARIEYDTEGFSESDADSNPHVLFERWFAEALAADLVEPTAMLLATATRHGVPSARAVLFKGMFEGGFTFYTNYESRKAVELEDNPVAAAVFLWQPMHRQVRLEGDVVRAPDQLSDSYFATRPPGSRLAAAVSPQSGVIPDRVWLENEYRALEEQHPDGVLPRPEGWGGYVLTPRVFEFWQGRVNRLHDRLRYRLSADGWIRERLAP